MFALLIGACMSIILLSLGLVMLLNPEIYFSLIVKLNRDSRRSVDYVTSLRLSGWLWRIGAFIVYTGAGAFVGYFVGLAILRQVIPLLIK